jgi:hypothetical protein
MHELVNANGAAMYDCVCEGTLKFLCKHASQSFLIFPSACGNGMKYAIQDWFNFTRSSDHLLELSPLLL